MVRVVEGTGDVNAGRVPLVTHNIRDFVIATQRFDISVYTPGQYLRKLMS